MEKKEIGYAIQRGKIGSGGEYVLVYSPKGQEIFTVCGELTGSSSGCVSVKVGDHAINVFGADGRTVGTYSV